MDWYEKVKRFGFWQACQASLLRNLTTHLNFHFWTIQTRTPEPEYIPLEEHASEFEFRTITEQEALAATRNTELGLSEAFVRSAFARDDICTGALIGGSLVAYSWKTLTRAPVCRRLWICIDQLPQFYGYKAFVLPKYRGRQVSRSVAKSSDAELVKRGAIWGVSYIAVSNLEQRAAKAKTNTSMIQGYAGYWKTGNYYWSFRTTGAKKYVRFEHSKTDITI